MEDDDDARSRSQSTSQSQTDSQTPPPSPPHPSVSIAVTPGSGHHQLPGGDAGRVAEPVTVAASPQRALAIALPVQQPRSSGKDYGGREDCWSEGATSTLIDAWGERYMELKRGNLKQKHWQEVADAVTSRDGYTKPPKTDIQCKNRIDTLKKKYKTEKTKISAAGSAAASSWPFFHRLDLLLGPNHKPSPVPTPPPPSQPNSHQKILAGVPIRPPSTQMRSQFPQRNRTSNHPAFKKMLSSPPSASSKSEDGASSADSSDGLPPPPSSAAANGKRQQPKKKHKQKQRQPPQRGTQEVEEGKMAGLRELTEAILRFGEVYERVESSKLQQATEMEKQRMAFARELEVQRMQFFMKTQVELSQLKSRSPHRGRSRKRRRLGDVGGSSNHNNGNNNNNSDNNE